MAVAVAAPVVIGLDAEAGGCGDGDGGDAPLEVPPPAEVDTKGAPPVEGLPVAVTAGGDDKEKDTKKDVKGEKGVNPVKWLGHYSSAQSILLVGDGDFSFSLALANAFGSGANLVPTSLDTYEALKNKYSKAESNIAELKRLGATVLHGVDAKEMKLHPDLKNRRFDRIVFNLPHAGFTGKEDDVHMINSHRELVWGFFCNAIHLLRPYCEIHISHKTGRSYDKWGLEDLASGASLVLVDKVAFQPEDYPGYNQKRGDSARCDEPFGLDACFTFKFRIRDLNSRKKLNGNMTSPISPLGIMAPATERGPFHLFSPPESWPQRHLPLQINAVQMVTTLETYEVVRRQHLDFPLYFDGIVRDLYFHQERNARPMLRTPRAISASFAMQASFLHQGAESHGPISLHLRRSTGINIDLLLMCQEGITLTWPRSNSGVHRESVKCGDRCCPGRLALGILPCWNTDTGTENPLRSKSGCAGWLRCMVGSEGSFGTWEVNV